MRGRALSALTLLCLAGCDKAMPPMPPIQHATRVVVTAGPRDDTLAVITDSARVAALTAFLNARREGWVEPWAGVPIPQVTAEFYDGAVFHGHIGAGTALLEVQRAGAFASRHASPEELAEFARLLGVPVSAFTRAR